MKQINFTQEQLSVLNAIQQEPLTSFQILEKVENVSMILSLYTIMDQLKNKGALKSFTKKNIKYHYSAA